MTTMDKNSQPVVKVSNVSKHFGGVMAVDGMNCDLYAGEVVGLLGHNGAGKSTLIKILSGVYVPDGGEIEVHGNSVKMDSPRAARAAGIETIHQTLALSDNFDAPSNLFLGRELMTRWGTLDKHRMEHEARKIIARLNPNFANIHRPVREMSGGQRQTVAIARALYFNARILIMDEPCAALGPAETQMVMDTIKRLKQEGIGVFLISHDIHEVFEVCDRVTVMKNGKLVGTRNTADVTQDEVLGMIILGKLPESDRKEPALEAELQATSSGAH
ncbi:MAG: ATP-binding cassette domain-containing protein [Pseudomonadota bacterium]